MNAQELVQELGLSGMEVETFREVFDSEQPLMTQALISYSALLSMSLELELFERGKNVVQEADWFFDDDGKRKINMTTEEFIMQCKYAGLSLRWK